MRFISSFTDVDDLPSTESEIAVVGRSNVGKSSLINALANRRNLAKTSKSPGATRLLNCFEIGPEGSDHWLVDVPGYGYSQRSKDEQQRWARMMERYLTQRTSLDAALHLIDGEIGPTGLDLQTQEWLAHIELPAIYVATKIDKIRPSKSKKRRAELVAALEVMKSDVSWVSATSGTGIPELRTRLAHHFRDL